MASKRNLDLLDEFFPDFSGDETPDQKIDAIVNYLKNAKQALQAYAEEEGT